MNKSVCSYKKAMKELGSNTIEDLVGNMSYLNDSNPMFLCEIQRYYQLGRWNTINSWSDTLSDILRSLLVIYYIAGCFVGTSLNLFLIVIVIKFKRLHKIDFYLTLQIVLVDFIFCIFLFPISATNAVSRQWTFDPGFCHFNGSLRALILEIRCLFLFILSLDRLSNVFFPLRYPNTQKRIVVILSAMTWTISVILALIPLYGLLDCFIYAPEYHGCTGGAGCRHKAACKVFGFSAAVFLNGSVVVALVMYFVMYVKAKKVNARVMPVSNTIGNEAAALQRRRGRQAMITLALYFIVLFAFSSPQLLFTEIPLLIENVTGFEFLPMWYDFVHVFTINLALAHSFVDPVVLMRNEDVRMVVKTLVRSVKDKLQRLRQKLGSADKQNA